MLPDRPQPSAVPFRYRLLAVPLRIFFKLLYNQFSWTYDWVAGAVSLGMWTEWVLSVMPYLTGPNVLELGHGPGHLQAALAEKQQATGEPDCIIGLDASSFMGRQARGRLVSRRLPFLLVRGLGQKLPFYPGSFQQVVATFPTEYIVYPETLSEIRRVLVPGGVLVMIPSAWITGRSILHRAAAWLFHFTGQSPAWEDRLLQPFTQAGLPARVEWIQTPKSRILIILAEKKGE